MFFVSCFLFYALTHLVLVACCSLWIWFFFFLLSHLAMCVFVKKKSIFLKKKRQDNALWLICVAMNPNWHGEKHNVWKMSPEDTGVLLFFLFFFFHFFFVFVFVWIDFFLTKRQNQLFHRFVLCVFLCVYFTCEFASECLYLQSPNIKSILTSVWELLETSKNKKVIFNFFF